MSSQEPPKHDRLNYRTAIIGLLTAVITAVITLWGVLTPYWKSGGQQSSSSTNNHGPTASGLETSVNAKPPPQKPQEKEDTEKPMSLTLPDRKEIKSGVTKDVEQPLPGVMKPGGPKNDVKSHVVDSAAVQAPDSGAAPVPPRRLIKAAIPATKVPRELMKPLPDRQSEPLSPEAIHKWNSELPGAKSVSK